MTPVTVRDLVAGNRVGLDQFGVDRSAIYVGQIDSHPLYPSLRLVLWFLDDGTWSHDALAPAQVVGFVDDHETPADRDRNLRRVFRGAR